MRLQEHPRIYHSLYIYDQLYRLMQSTRRDRTIKGQPDMDPPPARQNASTSSQTDSPNTPLHDEDCAFCQIITAYPPVSPLDPSFVSSTELDPEKLYPPAFVLLSTEHVVAFMDIFPLVRGHILLCPRRHAVKIGDMTSREGVEVSQKACYASPRSRLLGVPFSSGLGHVETWCWYNGTPTFCCCERERSHRRILLDQLTVQLVFSLPSARIH